MARGEVLVDGQLCYRFPDFANNLPEKNDVTCNPTLTGQVVKFSRRGNDGPESYLINICEVQVWGEYSRNSGVCVLYALCLCLCVCVCLCPSLSLS